MYIKEFKDLVTDDPFPMYQTERELIEADGEAEEIWLEQTCDNGYAERYFTAIDDVSDEDIELDITYYIGDKAFDRIDKVLMLMDEDEELTQTKLNSWLLACQKAKR